MQRADQNAVEAVSLQLVTGQPVVFRPLGAGDAGILGRYFVGLLDNTTKRFAPHAFDQATADRLCAELEPLQMLRLIGTREADGQEQVIGYFLLCFGVGEGTTQRYQRHGVALDPRTDCEVAPSVADAFQDQGVGTVFMQQLLETARRQGRRRAVLMGGTMATNSRAIHFYEKLGFRKVGEFETPPGRYNHDMILEL